MLYSLLFGLAGNNSLYLTCIPIEWVSYLHIHAVSHYLWHGLCSESEQLYKNRVNAKIYLTPTATVFMFAAGFALIFRQVTGIGLISNQNENFRKSRFHIFKKHKENASVVLRSEFLLKMLY